ncbi:SDR family oxidoreductase [Streptomyces violascens]|uniref:Short-chain dehydrogenase n=1 Tax=Streptomyces violascens TaxID=67381 RepID=A0ABQ3QM92_9ACTN|nr:SDR family oxidoreductase [Streptomyces violascens]GGT99086.1 short-chain dehydrogenase [Streptomyces violascens]GHI38381.1 short-chain dehydrogenase [Streptomyces violascens]
MQQHQQHQGEQGQQGQGRPARALARKTALVTGASRGIGRGIAQRLAADGALVVVHYGTDGPAAQETVDAIVEAGGRAFAVGAELDTVDGVEQLADAVRSGLRAHTGEEFLDILVNNAAVTGHLPYAETTPDLFDRLFAVNVRAPFFLAQHLLPTLRDGGRIITIGSAVTRIALEGELAYTMTKGAMETYTRTLANAVGARRITVNLVAPGPTETDRTRAFFRSSPEMEANMIQAQALPWIGQPADIADPVAFLASDDARWVTGHVLDASGGTYLGPKF